MNVTKLAYQFTILMSITESLQLSDGYVGLLLTVDNASEY